MAKAIIERIANWIKDAIDGVQDTVAILTFNVVCPKIVDWQVQDFKHGDVIMEFVTAGPGEIKTTSGSCEEVADWSLYAIITKLPDNMDADTVLDHMAETIQRALLSGNKRGRACGGLALNIGCPEIKYGAMAGGLVIDVSVRVRI